MLEKIFDPIFSPFRRLRSLIFSVQQAPAQLKGEVSRVQAEAASFKGEAQQYAAKAKGAKAPKIEKPKKRWFGLFGKKVACESCGQKLHPSWDECPYCGWKKGTPAAAAGGGAAAAGAAAAGGSAAAAGGASAPQRTMALDAGAIAGLTGMGLGWFIPLEGKRVGELIELRGRVSVGKSADNQVQIEDPSISGHHCEFVGSPNGFKLNDLGSTNGTFVNDKRIQTHDLVDNDNVTLGRVRFKFKSLN